MSENNTESDEKQGLAESISGLGQAILGQIETLAGVVNADPLARPRANITSL